jgi:hypothetical protein
MTEFNPRRDQLLGQSCLSYQLQLRLPENARTALAGIASLVKEIAPEGIWIAPSESLHVTCYSLVSPRDNSYDKERYWHHASSSAVEAVRRVGLEVPSCSLDFFALRVTDGAVIAIAKEDPSVAAARTIVSHLVPPPVTPPAQPSRGIHATLCRYNDPAAVPRNLPQIVEGLQSDVRADIDMLVLVRETIYPSLKTETIVSARLDGKVR